jgi:hypothetical protein
VTVDPDPAECFGRALAALDGTSVPLSAAGSKMLWYMLEQPEGCDAWITRERFVVQYGWHLSHHRYFSDVAVEVTSWLFDVLGAREGVLSADALPTIPPFMAWSYGPRAVWIAATTDKITIQIREAVSAVLPAEPPSPIEPPIEYVAGTRPCPSCGCTPDRYRRLRGGALVCLACGASSTIEA